MNKAKMLTHHCPDLPNYSNYSLYLNLEIVESIRVGFFLKMNLEAIVKLCLSIFLGQKMLEEDWNVCFAKIIVFATSIFLDDNEKNYIEPNL